MRRGAAPSGAASSVEHVDENARAADLRLSAAELVRIDEAFRLPGESQGFPLI